MAPAVVVKRVRHNDVPRIFKKVAAAAERTGAGYGVERAQIYVPVRTGKLRLSIRVVEGNSFEARTRYAYYVETGRGRGPAQPYMEPAARDVARAMPEIIKREFRRWAFG